MSELLNGSQQTCCMTQQVPPIPIVKVPMSIWRTVLYAVCILLWLALFCSGIVIGTKYYRDQLGQGLGEWYWQVHCFCIVFLNYSMSNIALLSCLSAVIGGMTHSNPENIIQLLAKGLFIYMLMLAGSLTIGNEPFTEIAQSQYIRIAVVTSVAAFCLGYFPDKFNELIGHTANRMSNSEQIGAGIDKKV